MKRFFRAAAASTLLLSLVTFSGTAIAAETTTSSAAVGKSAPAFNLTDTNGKKRSLADASGKWVVLEWINYDCPFVRKHYESNNMQKLQKTYTGKGVLWYAINSSAPGRQGNYPAEKVNELMKKNNTAVTAYLLDPEGTVGKAYGAKATPHMFVIDPKGTLVYAGAIDDNSSADISEKANVNYVQKALDEGMASKPISVASTPAYGCSVKYAK